MNKEFNDFAKLPFLKKLSQRIEETACNLPEEIISEGLESIIFEISNVFNDNIKDSLFKDYILASGQTYDSIELIKINKGIDINIVHFSSLVFDVELGKNQNKITKFKTNLSEINFQKYVSGITLEYIVESEKMGFKTNHLDYVTMFFLSHDSTNNGFSYFPEFENPPINQVQQKINEMAIVYNAMLNNNVGDQFMDIFLKNKKLNPEYIDMFQLLYDVKAEGIFNENFMIDINKEIFNLKNEIKNLQRLNKSQVTF